MKGLIPNLTINGSPEPRKITKVNMDNVFNLLCNILSGMDVPYMEKLTGVISLLYNRIQVLYTEDPLTCLKHLKLIFKWYVEMIRGVNVGNPGLEAWYWNNDLNCPVLIDNVISEWNSLSADELVLIDDWHQIILAMLSIHRVMVIPVAPNYDTITKPPVTMDPKSPLAFNNINGLANRLGISPKEFRAEYDRQCANFKYTVLSSAGVNGKATWTAHSDSIAWVKEGKLIEHLTLFLKESKMEHILKDLLSCIPTPSTEACQPVDAILGRLHAIEEWGGKTRIVAIVDYWTQMVLTPLHNTINHFLRNLEMDGTFDQDSMAETVRGWTGTSGLEVNSFDLTAATDRLPISLQVNILEHLTGSHNLARMWKEILTCRDFYCQDGSKVRYATGQPMGARSSFPMLALTHHFIVQHAAELNKVHGYTSYRILGDDNTMCRNDVSSSYLAIMGYLGVPVNLSKSVICRADGLSAAEICKRIFIEGVEYTTISVKLLAKVARDGKLAPTLQDDLSKRGFKLTPDRNTTLMFSICDPDSFRDIMIMNILPEEVCGLTAPLPNDQFHLADYSKWYEGTPLTEQDIIDVFTYTAAVNQLKRLDALLRATLAISSAISQRYAFYTKSPLSVEHLWAVLGIPTSITSGEISKYIASIEKLEPSHPIIQASEAEITRITELLAGLISHNTEMHKRARSGLLDLMRNALVDVWTDAEAARAQGGRTILTDSLNNLSKAIAKVSSEQPLVKLEFSVNLSMIQKLWSVRWIRGQGVTINMVKSRIPASVGLVKAGASSALNQISISRR